MQISAHFFLKKVANGVLSTIHNAGRGYNETQTMRLNSHFAV